VDTFSLRYLDRYAEQLWDTLFAKAHEITLFEWSAMSRPIEPGNRAAWEKLPASFNFDALVKGDSQPTMARVAGYALEQADPFSAGWASRSASPATSPINPPARISCTIISA
jgi:hypothetical protein